MKAPWIAEASRKRKLLVGVSGGVDSMALLYLLSESGFAKVVVCHLNHGLRGKESAGDAAFVKRVAGKLGYEVEARKVNLKKFMEESGESMETAGRNARHDFFAECGRKHRCKTLLLAHHADDQAETVLWNLMRGGLGCRGMRKESVLKMDGREMTVIRPLLGVRKSEIESWMAGRKLKWREDASNAVNDVVRNRLRNEALPLLNDISKRDVAPSLVRAAETDEEWRGLLEWAMGEADVFDPQGRLHLKQMKRLPDVLKRAVFADYLGGKGVGGIDQSLLNRCLGLLDVENPAKINLPGGAWLRRRGGRIFMER